MTLGNIALTIAIAGIVAMLELMDKGHDKEKEVVFEND